MPVGELLQRMGSFEVAEWIAELTMRADEEKAAYDKARAEPPPVMGGRR